MIDGNLSMLLLIAIMVVAWFLTLPSGWGTAIVIPLVVIWIFLPKEFNLEVKE